VATLIDQLICDSVVLDVCCSSCRT